MDLERRVFSLVGIGTSGCYLDDGNVSSRL